jgi:hypothetical protein
MSVTGDGETANTSGLTVAPDLSAVELGITVAARGNVDAHVDVVFTDFGKLFRLPQRAIVGKSKFQRELGRSEAFGEDCVERWQCYTPRRPYLAQ